jgi:EAL domain-containing protein (putative c-di-GMP-specific phosphodiesterase class I)/CheY-like chemotaxis protein
MDERTTEATFGRRKVTPRVCVADAKQHVRTFLGEALEDIGFITCQCAQPSELVAVLDAQLPDLIVIGLSTWKLEAGEMLQTLATNGFAGKVLLVGPRNSLVLAATRELGEQLGLAMLPVLATPYGESELADSVAMLLPTEAPPNPAINVAEALHAGWLELWYQPKIGMRMLALSGAEGVIRVRHPHWGVVPPAYFMADDGDPHFGALSEFIIGRAAADWQSFVAECAPVEIAINLPIAVLKGPQSIPDLCRQLPDHPAFQGLIIEINAAEIIGDLTFAIDIAKQLRFHNIGISIDDLGADWPTLMGVDDFPFVEIKVDRKFVAGCADDPLKQRACRRIVELADAFGARTVAEGVERRADFVTVREMGFDLAQGVLFAKPMPAKKFARTMLRRPLAMPQ